MNARIRARFPEMSPMAGFAATATFRSARPPRQGDSYECTFTQVERCSILPLIIALRPEVLEDHGQVEAINLISTEVGSEAIGGEPLVPVNVRSNPGIHPPDQ